MARRFGDAARIAYVDTSDPVSRASHEALITKVAERGLVYPVTVVDGSPIYDGAVSYPAIIRAVEGRVAAERA